MDNRPGQPPQKGKQGRPAPAPTVREGLKDAAKNLARDTFLEKRPYLKFAFANPYNLSLLGGALLAAGVTLNPFLAAIALGAEALWLLYAPDSTRLRMLLWDPRFDTLRRALEAEERSKRMANLSARDRERVGLLIEKQQQINSLAERNPSFTGELLKTELTKTGRLVDAFIEMAITCGRYEEYLDSIDLGGLERDRARWEREVRSGTNGDPQTEVAKKNFAIILKRIDKMREIQSYLKTARSQLDLMENSFQLIADQIVTMQSPQELSGQLDELLVGVESIRETAIDTEKFLNTINV